MELLALIENRHLQTTKNQMVHLYAYLNILGLKNKSI